MVLGRVTPLLREAGHDVHTPTLTGVGERAQLRRPDPVGGDLAEPALRSLRWGGRFVTVGYASGAIPRIPLNLVLLKGVQVLGFQLVDFARHAADDFARNEEEMTALLASQRVAPHIGARHPLDDVAAALRLVSDGAAIGKVVIDLDG